MRRLALQTLHGGKRVGTNGAELGSLRFSERIEGRANDFEQTLIMEENAMYIQRPKDNKHEGPAAAGFLPEVGA